MSNRNRLIPKDGPRLSGLFGMDAAKEWGEDLANDLSAWAAKKIAWSEVNRGLLIHGLPGTGKNLFVEALAATCGLPLISATYARWQRSRNGHMGDVLAAMHETFVLAKQYAPCILFIDEFEAVSSREIAGHNQSWYTGIITGLNEELNELLAHEGVVVIAAANYPDRVDPALLRPGRLDREIAIPPPSAKDLEGIIRFHLEDELPDANLSDLALAAVGMTGAHVERAVRDARRRARKFGRALLIEDLFAVLGEKVRELSKDYLDRIAVHEAGHAVAAILLGVSPNVSVSLFHPVHGNAATFFDPPLQALTRRVVEQRLAVALAGRAAEYALLGDVSGGADTDICAARRLAETAISEWGLFTPTRIPPAKRSAHRREAARLLDTTYAQALDLIREHKTQVRAVADALIARRALGHAEIVALMTRISPGSRKAPARGRARKRA
jgi:ATP-dependent Zn protease